MLFIYHFENHEQLGPPAAAVLRGAEDGQHRLVTSELTLLEILVIPKRLGLQALCQKYRELLDSFPNLSLHPIDREILETASDLRARYGLRTPDALQIATSIQSKAEGFISHDQRLKAVQEIPILPLSKF
jgi:predicted nucleic acid-binding protein